MHLADRQVDKGLCVDDLHRILPHQFELHDHDIVLNVLQVDILSIGWLLNRGDTTSLQEVLNLLLALTLHQKLVPVVGLLIHLVVVHGAPDLHKLGNGALLKDLLTSLLLHCLSSIFLLCLSLILFRHDARVEVLGQ